MLVKGLNLSNNLFLFYLAILKLFKNDFYKWPFINNNLKYFKMLSSTYVIKIMLMQYIDVFIWATTIVQLNFA